MRHVFFLSTAAGLAAACSANAQLFDEVSLSQAARDALVVHFDGRTGVQTSNGQTVTSWQGFNGTGDEIVAELFSLARPGGGEPELITTDGFWVYFDDPTTAAFGRRLEGPLATSAANLSYTIFWLGHYDSDDRNGFARSGLYAYNIGSQMSHQRDDDPFDPDVFNIELYDGSVTHIGDSILPFDDKPTVWTTIYTIDSHVAYADGVNLNVGGTPSYTVPQNPTMVMGAFSSGGFDMLGQIGQFIVFEAVLDRADIDAMEAYLASLIAPPCRADLDGDGELTLFDFLAFQNLFSLGDPRADFDGDGDLTLFDFLAFQNEFAIGCP